MIETERWVVRGHDETWSHDELRRFATWSVRIEQLLPDDARISIDWSVVDIDSSTLQADFEAGPLDYPQIFAETARLVGASEQEITAAMAAPPRPFFTIEVIATADQAVAEEAAAALNELDPLVASTPDPHGAYEAGGFPAMNAFAHVIEDRGDHATTYHVVIGAFDSQRTARAVLQRLRDTGEGTRAFVRGL